MERADFHRHVGPENICGNVGEAMARAEQIHRERPRNASSDRQEVTA
jgi:hypothetical protein